ncbi:hypothetical protein J3F84DRAFT_383339 [Trichoderma pleuroticola]
MLQGAHLYVLVTASSAAVVVQALCLVHAASTPCDTRTCLDRGFAGTRILAAACVFSKDRRAARHGSCMSLLTTE